MSDGPSGYPKHPQSCTDPDCELTSYREHLLGISIGASALPTRCPGAAQTNIREKRWDKDMGAFKRLVDDGYSPPAIDGAAFRESQADVAMDVIDKPVDINYAKPGGDQWSKSPSQFEVPYR